MAKKIVWSKSARKSLFQILNFWSTKNKSNLYSEHLIKLFNNATNLIVAFPNSGKRSEYENVRLKIVRNYIIIYEIEESQIVILIIWDSKQDPETLKEFFKKKV